MPTPPLSESRTASCLDEDTALEVIFGRLAPEAASRANAHIDSCERCRHWVAELARAEQDPAELDTVDSPTLPSGRTTSELSPGQSVAHYEVQRRIGAGGMSLVYAALDKDLGRTVALKILKPQVAAVGSTRTRLLREAQAMARLSHPNVLTVHEAKESEGLLYIAMEFVEGVTLSAWLRESRRTVPQVLAVFMEAGKGLAAAHAAGIIHRDFKPENVMIGSDGRVRVTDFGLARWAGRVPVPVDEPITQVGAFVGTPAYTSPEQLSGQPVDARSDEFCFCVALYEGLYGQRPFAGLSVTEVSGAMRQSDPQVPLDGRRVPGWLERIVRKGLSRAPDDRYPSMDALLQALSKGLHAPGRSLPAMGVGLLAVLALSGAAWVMLAGRPPPPVPVAAVQPIAVAVAPPAPVPPPPTPAPMEAAPAEQAHSHLVARHRPALSSPAKLSDAPNAPPASGWLRLEPSGLGFAEVYIDDDRAPRGRIPRQDPFELTAGAHRIRVERAGQLLDEKRVTVAPDGTATLSVNVERH